MNDCTSYFQVIYVRLRCNICLYSHFSQKFLFMIVIRSIMVWTEEKDVKLLRAVAAEGVFINSRAGSRERGALWQVVASSLMAEGMPVISRSVRDRFNILAKKWRIKVRQEERESGGGDKEMSEAEKLVELEMEIEKTKEQNDEAKKLVEGEKKKAIEMRERAMERFRQTKKREEETEKDEGKKEKKRRRSGEAIEWLREKGENMREMKEQELQERREEREAQKAQTEQFMSQMQAQNEQKKLFQ